MPGETDLRTLLASMRPRLDGRTFVFVTMQGSGKTPEGIAPIMSFAEREGTTFIVAQDEALAAGIECTFPCRMITLDIHSSLEAVGFLAAILPHLAAVGIGVNPVAAYHHDHLFVPSDRAEDALAILRTIAHEAGG